MEATLSIIATITLCTVVIAWLSLAPWVPTSAKDLERVHKLANLKKGQKFYEIGCGNGRVCTYIAKKNPNSEVIGIEYALPFYLFSKFRQLLLGPRNLKIKFGNALKKDFSNADIIYVYALKDTLNGSLKKKLTKELKPGAKLISYVFSLTDWPGIVEKHTAAPNQFAIHTYTHPES